MTLVNMSRRNRAVFIEALNSRMANGSLTILPLWLVTDGFAETVDSSRNGCLVVDITFSKLKSSGNKDLSINLAHKLF